MTGAVNTAPSTRMTIANNGNVGIGMTAPGVRFEVESPGTSQNVARLSRSGGTWGAYWYEDASGHMEYRMQDATDSDKIILRSSGDSYFNGGGNVGIGTTSPADPLHIDGGQLRLSNTAAVSLTGSAAGLLNYN